MLSSKSLRARTLVAVSIDNGCHHAVRKLQIAGVPQDLVEAIILPRMTRWPTPNEIGSTVRNIYGNIDQPGDQPIKPPPPLIDPVRRAQVIAQCDITLADLKDSSPVKFSGAESHAEEIIDRLFPPNSLICCAAKRRKLRYAASRKMARTPRQTAADGALPDELSLWHYQRRPAIRTLPGQYGPATLPRCRTRLRHFIGTNRRPDALSRIPQFGARSLFRRQIPPRMVLHRGTRRTARRPVHE